MGLPNRRRGRHEAQEEPHRLCGVDPDGELLTVTNGGFAKRSALGEYSVPGGATARHRHLGDRQDGRRRGDRDPAPEGDNAWMVFVTAKRRPKRR